MDETDSYQVQTATTEAINNAITHAYNNHPGHSVNVDWVLHGDLIQIKVCDQGKTMNQIPPDIEPSPEAESGRGWWIMRRWMDKIEYKTIGEHNMVILQKQISL